MSDDIDPLSRLPGWTVIGSREELDAHDPHDPAYLLLPPALVRPVWVWLGALTLSDCLGELARGIELLLVGLEAPDSRLMVSAHGQITRGLKQIMVRGQLEPVEGREDEPVAMGDGEKEGEEPDTEEA